MTDQTPANPADAISAVPHAGGGGPVVPSSGSASARLRGLLDAHRAITGDLSLDAMLDRTVRAACDLVGSDVAVLAVTSGEAGPGTEEMDASGHLLGRAVLEQVVQHGLTPEQVPPVTVALRRALAAGTRALPGFHATPITIRGSVFGTLYLAKPGAAGFDAEDAELIAALATMAGTAVGHARLYDDARRSRDWAGATVHLSHALLSGDSESRLTEVVARAAEVADVDSVGLILPLGGTQLQVAVILGVGTETWSGMTFDGRDSAIGRAVLSGRSLLLGDIMDLAVEDFDNTDNLGPMMITPLTDADGLRGSLVLTRLVGRPSFSERDLALASAFAAQAALSLQLDDARADREQLAVLGVRNRLAEDLHDNVMQRLFAIGMGLQGMLADLERVPGAGLPDDGMPRRLARHVAELDETIDEIRERIFGLRGRGASCPQQARRVPHIGRVPAADSVAARESGAAHHGSAAVLRHADDPTPAA